MAKSKCLSEVTEILAKAFEGFAGVNFEISAEVIAQKVSQAQAKAFDKLGTRNTEAYENMVTEDVLNELRSDVSRAQLITAHRMQNIAHQVGYIKKVYPDNPALGLKALLVGDATHRQGGRNSVALAQKEATQRYHRDLIHDLKQEGVYDAFWSSSLDDQIDDAGHHLSTNNQMELDKLEPEAIKIAEILQRNASLRRIEANRYGAGISSLKGRLYRQSHEVHNVLRASSVLDPNRRRKFRNSGSSHDEKAWVEFVMKNIDEVATFPAKVRQEGTQAKHDWLRAVFQEFRKGRTGDYLMKSDETYEGIAPHKAINEDRVLHFTREGAKAYRKTFGLGSIKETVASEIELMGHRVGLLDTLGVDPHKTLMGVIDATAKRLPEGSKELAKLTRHVGKLKDGEFNGRIGMQYATVTGTTNHIASEVGAIAGASLRAFQNVTKLGFAAISSIADVGNMSADLMAQQGNMTFFESFFSAVRAPLEGFMDGDRRAFAEAAGIGLDGMIGMSFDRMGSTDAPLGAMNKLMNTYFKWNALGPWTDATRKGLYLANSNYMAKVLRDPSVAKNGAHKHLLESYDITDADMDFLREYLPMTVIDGKEYFNTPEIGRLPTSVFSLSDAEVNLVNKQVGILGERFRDPLVLDMLKAKRGDLEKKFNSFFIDRNDFGVLTPGADTRAMIQQGRGRGDMFREIMETFLQFKQFPISMVNMLYMRDSKGLGSKPFGSNGELGLMASHIAMLTGFGALSAHLKETMKGRVPFIPQDGEELRKYMGRAMLHGGAMGLYGDFLLGKSFGTADKLIGLTGPTGGDIVNLAKLGKAGFLDAFGNDEYDPQYGSKLWKTMRNSIPFANSYQSKLLLDYTIFFNIAETLDPGYLQRHETGVKSYNAGRGYILPPSEVIPYGGLRNLAGE